MSDSLELKRRRLFCDAGQEAAQVFNDVTQELHGQPADIAFNKNSKEVDRLVKAYFAEVQRFKQKNDFPDGDLINPAKRAALTIKVLVQADFDALFSASPAYRNSLDKALLGPYYIYSLTCGILDIRIRFIDTDTERDLMICIMNAVRTKALIDDEWLCWAMRVFQKASQTR